MEPPPPAPPPRSPLRPPPQPAPTSSSTLSKRQHALHELMSSERAYASDLTLILEVHIPLADGPMTADDVKIVFGNIGELAELSDVFCEALERTIGSALEDPDATDDHIGELFLRYAPELEGPYKQYITRHPSALAHLTALPQTPELTAYHQKTRDLAVSLSHAWDLQSLLIKPVQRLLKYSLLLTAIIDATALTHPDRPHLVNARTTMEEVARQVNEGRRRAEVVKEVLTAPKKPPTLLRIKSFRAPVGDPNSDAARVDRMAAELARIDVFAQQLARTAQEWARAADAAALALLAWANSFSAAIGLSSAVRSEAFDTFLATLTDSILPLSSGLLPAIAADLLAPLARLLASAAQPRQLLASMAEHAPLHHHLLTMPLSAKNRPPPALLSASAHYLALRTQLAAELPAYLALLHRGLSALVRRLAGLQAGFFGEARDAWAGLWDMLRVEGERNGGGEETVGVWRARWGDVDNGVAGLRICRPLRGSSTLGPAAAQLTPAEAVVRAYSEPAPINTESSSSYANGGPPSPHYERNFRDRDYNQRGEYSYRDSSNSGGGNTRDYSTSRNNRDSSGASVHTNTSSTSSGKAAHVSNVLAALDPGLGGRRAPAHSNSMSSGYTSTSGGYGAASSSYATSMASGSPPPPTISGPFSLGSISGKPKGASDGYSGTGASSSYAPSAYSYSPGAGAGPHSPGWERAGFAGWNENGSTGRGKSPARGASANESSGANGSGSGLSRSGSRRGSAPVLANRNGNGASKFDLSKVDPNTFPMGDTGTVRRSHSPTPTTMTTRTVKDGQEEFGEVVAEIGWGDYGGSILPPKRVKDPAREEEKAREKERERRRREEEKERKEREKAKKREEKKASKDGKGGAFGGILGGGGGGSNSNSSEPSPRSSLASSRLALLEGAGYGFREKSPAPKKTKSKSKQREEERRGSDHLTSSQSNSNGNSNRDSKNSSGSRGASRPPSRGRSTMDEQYVHPYANATAYASPRAAPIPPGASASAFFPSSPPSGSAIRSQRSRPPSPPPPPDFDNAFTGAARRATWLAAPAQYSCRVVHPCTPPAAVSYFGFPFFALEEHALLGVLHEAGHPGTHPRLPLYVDEGEDCLLLCRDAGGEVGWALASFLAPLAAD